MAHLRHVVTLICTATIFCIVICVFGHRVLLNQEMTELQAFIHYLPWWGLAIVCAVVFAAIQKYEYYLEAKQRDERRKQNDGGVSG